MEIILSHTHADFDALASMVAARKLYPQAHPLLTGSVDQAVKEFLSLYKNFVNVDYARAVRDMEVVRVILVDTRVPARLGEFRELVSTPQVEVIIYDHHPPTFESIVGDQNTIEHVGATTTLLVRILQEREIGVTPLEATLFCLGIYEETGCLTYPDTTSEDAEAVAWCLSNGAMLSIVTSFLHRTLTEDQRLLLNDLLVFSKIHTLHGLKVLTSKTSFNRYIDELAVVTHRLMDIEGTDAAITMVKMKDRIYVVGRSLENTVDVAQVLGSLGGGGHTTAASASIKGWDLDSVEKELMTLLAREIRAPYTARDVMTSPVICLTGEHPLVRQAHEMFVRYGFSGFPVLQDGKLVGMVSRKDVDKAMSHSLSNAPLSTLTSSPVITALPDAPLPDIRRMLVDEDIGRVPIVENGELKGIITRNDILRTVHSCVIARPSPESEALERLRALPLAVQDIIEKAGDVADELGFPAFVVGGFVRDLLVGMETADIDLVAEGDGILFAEKLARRLGGRIRSHEKFGTAVVLLSSGTKVDVATARVEFYTRPAALPEVMASPLKQDLYRRDFSINALAIRLNRKEYGKLYDFFGARRDLRDGVVRVLHNLSFIDDPTRIFRAIKFEQRYHFKMDQHTESLLRAAVAENVFEHVSSERIRDEIIQILSEARPIPAIKRMDQLRVLKLIHPRIALNSKVLGILEDITATLVQFAPRLEGANVEKWLIYFTGVIADLHAGEIAEIAHRYRISQVQRSKLTLDAETTTRIVRALFPKHIRPSDIHRELQGLSVEMLLYLYARTGLSAVKQKISSYLFTWRKVKPLVRGQHLRHWGIPEGPWMRTILDETFAAQLNGEIGSLEQARTYVDDHFPERTCDAQPGSRGQVVVGTDCSHEPEDESLKVQGR